MTKILSTIRKLFAGNDITPTPAPYVLTQDSIIQIHNSADKYYNLEDLVFFDEIQCYGAVKYEVVKELLFSEKLGVSPMHTALNRIYFQTDQERHSQNKRAAIKHLTFLSKKLQFENNDYLIMVFNIIKKELPKDKVFNLVDAVINPVLLINALNDFGFLNVLPEFDPNRVGFSYNTMVQKSTEIYNNRSVLEKLLEGRMNENNIPHLIQQILDEVSVEGGVDKKELPLFYTTIIYTAIENTSSFVSSLAYFVIKKYPKLFNRNSGVQLMDLGNELLRIYSPNFITFRTALEDIETRGISLKKGDLVALYIGAANRDPLVFNEPMKVQLNRPEKHLAFGRGRISCIGQYAAFRAALNIIKCLSDDADKLMIVDEEPKYVTLGVVKLPTINIIYVA